MRLAVLGAVALMAALAPAIAAAPAPVYVLGPLTDVSDWTAFHKQLATLKANGVTGVSTDLWWGEFEAKDDQSFDWSYYLKYADAVRAAGLKWEPILSFHQCGGNPGDDCNVPLPRWVWTASARPDQEMKFVDDAGFVDGEYIAPWYPGAARFYDRAMASFAKTFAPYAGTIAKIQISLGPAGELRYPSYNSAAGWTYPGAGRLEAYSAAARASLRAYVRAKYAGRVERLNAAWKTSLRSFDDVAPPKDSAAFFARDARSPYGRDFLKWYQASLENHLERMMKIARKRLSPTFPHARLGGKVSGVHWLYDSPRTPHAAENAAGYADYDELAAAFKKAGADLTFTALEMDDSDADKPPFYSAPRSLALAVAAAARKNGVVLDGENAMPIVNDESRYRNLADMLSNHGYTALTLLRLGQIVDAQGNPTPEMAPFSRIVVSPTTP